MPSALFYVGGVNRGIGYVAKPAGQGIAAFELDLETGAAHPLGVTGGIDNPTFVAVSPDGRTLAAVSEIDGWHEGVITTFAVDRDSGALSYRNMQATRGDYTCHMGFDGKGQYAGIANYGGQPVSELPNKSFAIYPLYDDATIGPLCAEQTHIGTGPVTDRQDRPHAHCIRWSPDNRFVLVADLGIDRIMIYRFDAARGQISAHGAGVLPAGAGPRHFVFHPHLPLVYCVGELDCTLVTLRWDTEAGTLETVSAVSSLPAGDHPGSSGSAIAITRDGRHVFVGNRGHDSVARFSLDETGRSALLGTTPTRGRIPRDFAFDPTGNVLAVANQESDLVTLFRYRAESGDLEPIEPAIAVGSPTAIAFHPQVR